MINTKAGGTGGKTHRGNVSAAEMLHNVGRQATVTGRGKNWGGVGKDPERCQGGKDDKAGEILKQN